MALIPARNQIQEIAAANTESGPVLDGLAYYPFRCAVKLRIWYGDGRWCDVKLLDQQPAKPNYEDAQYDPR